MVSKLDSFLTSYSKYHQKLIPEDAKMLHALLKTGDSISKWTYRCPGSIRLPGFGLALSSVPVALLSGVGFAARGILRGAVEVLNFQGKEAANQFFKDEFSALKCVAITVSSLCLAVFSLLFGIPSMNKFIFEEKREASVIDVPKLQNDLDSERRRAEALQNDLNEEKKRLGVLQAQIAVRDLEEENMGGDLSLSVLHGSLRARTPEVKKEGGWWGALAGGYGYVKNMFINADDPWKLNRYHVSLQQLIAKVGQDKLEAWEKRADDMTQVEASKTLGIYLKSALGCLTTPQVFSNSRMQFQEFHKSLRGALLAAEAPFLRKEKEELEALCNLWFTTIYMLPFNYEMARVLAEHGHADGKILARDTSLHDKLIYLLEGIRHLSAKETTPVAHVLAEKVTTITNYFDPSYKNMPSQWAEFEYQARDGSRITTTQMRTCVPIKNSDEAHLGALRPWEIEVPGNSPIRITPEYLAFLRHLKAKGEKILNIIHLDPHYYDAKTKQLSGDGHRILAANIDIKKAKAREALWIALMVKLSNSHEFKGVFHAAVLPMDGKWLKTEIEKDSKGKTLTDFCNWFETVTIGPQSLFLIPEEIKDKKEFFNQVTTRVVEEYFGAFKDGDKLDKEDMLAFYGLWASKASEELQFALKINVTQRNCKDAVDRTMALVGSELCEKTSRIGRTDSQLLGSMQKRENQEAILGTTLGPALGALKRGLLEEREPVLLATVKFLEGLKKVGPPSEVHGYRLTKVTMGQDEAQTLYPPPATAKTEANYLEWLRLAIENPRSLPPSLTIPNAFHEVMKDYKDRDEAFKAQVTKDLSRLKLYFEGKQLSINNYDELKVWLQGQNLKGDRASIALNQGFLEPISTILGKLYTQPDLHFQVNSPSKTYEFIRDPKTKKMHLHVKADFPISDPTAKECAKIKATLLVPLESEKMPTYKWSIESSSL